MKIQLFDDDDLKALEDAIARAVARGLYRAVVTLAKNNLWPAAQAQDAAPEPPATTAVPDPEPPTQMAVPDNVGDIISRWGGPVAKHDAAPPPPKKTWTPSRQNSTLAFTKVLRVVGHRPEGFIKIAEAYELVHGIPRAAQMTALRRWILNTEVRAVIVSGYEPSKGLPGQVCVLRTDVLARDRLRKKNASIPEPRRRVAPPRYDNSAIVT